MLYQSKYKQAIMMTPEDQLAFEQYFQLAHPVPLNVKLGGDICQLPDQQTFENSIPLAYKVASEMQGLEQNMLRPLRQLGDVIEPLAEYLKAQSRKIDLMMSYVLQSQDENDIKLATTTFGGGGFTFVSEQQFTTEHYLQCKLFFNEDAAAIYCYAKVADVTTTEEGNQYTMVFCRIRDDDREIVVRASLHLQSKQLLQKTKQKQGE